MASELTPGELSARSGVAISALHFYERACLITSRRTGEDWALLSTRWRDDPDERANPADVLAEKGPGPARV